MSRDRSTAGIASITHPVYDLPEWSFQRGGERGEEIHNNVIRRRLWMTAGPRFGREAVSVVGKSNNQGSDMGGKELCRVLQLQG